MKNKTIQDDGFQKRFRERKKRCLQNRMWFNLLLLLAPTLALILLIGLSLLTSGLSLFLIYFILPMFYTVERRLVYDVSGTGNPDFSYADGYKAFFQQNMGGVFGALSTVFSTIGYMLFFYLILVTVFPALCTVFPGATDAYTAFAGAYQNTETSFHDMIGVMEENIAALSRPLTVIVGLIAALPMAYAIFYSIDFHLCNHYLSSMVLPDIDKNISAAQARSLARGSFGRYCMKHRLKQAFKQNWPYVVAYLGLYGILLWGMSTISVSNLYLLPIVVSVAPAGSFLFGMYLNYFCLMNDYLTLEESQDTIRSCLPGPMKMSIYQTYINPNYIHGEESALRGCFVPAPNQEEYDAYERSMKNNPFMNGSFSDQRQNTSSGYNPEGFQENDNSTADSDKQDTSEETPSEPPQGGVFDFSDVKSSSEKDNKKKE